MPKIYRMSKLLMSRSWSESVRALRRELKNVWITGDSFIRYGNICSANIGVLVHEYNINKDNNIYVVAMSCRWLTKLWKKYNIDHQHLYSGSNTVVMIRFNVLTRARHKLGILELVNRAVYNFVPTSFEETRTGTINVNVLLRVTVSRSDQRIAAWGHSWALGTAHYSLSLRITDIAC